MIKCHFARLLGEHKKKISDVSRDTGINRGTLTRMYYEEAERIELAVLDQLCAYFNVELHQLLERVSDAPQPVNGVQASPDK